MPHHGKVKFDLSELGAEDVRVAEKELRETPKIRCEALIELRRLLKADGTLIVPLSDEFLLKFLRPTKFYPESAYNLIKTALEYKEDNIEELDGLSVHSEKRSLVEGRMGNVLIDRDQRGRRIGIVTLGKTWDTTIVQTRELFRLLYIVQIAASCEPKTQVHGLTIIFDFDGLSLKHIRFFGPRIALKIVTLVQDAMPLRIKAIHMVRQPFIFNILWNLFKPFFRQKLRSRIFFHGTNFASLHEHILPCHLTQDLGGTLPPVTYTTEDWYYALGELENAVDEYMNCKIKKTK